METDNSQTKWIVLTIIGFVGFFACVGSSIVFSNKIIVVAPMFWLCVAIGILKSQKKLTQRVQTALYGEEYVQKRQKERAEMLEVLRVCYSDFRSKHNILLLAPFAFFIFASYAMIMLFYIDKQAGKIEENPKSIKELLSLNFKNNPIPCVLLGLVVLMSPVVFVMFIKIGVYSIIPAFVCCNLASGVVTFPFIILKAIVLQFFK